jgi:hypothetical protein
MGSLSQNAKTGTELTATMTGSWVQIGGTSGALTQNPVQIIFDNQGTVNIAISTDGGTTTWRTFTGGEAIILDMRANHGNAPDFTFPKGTAFFGNGASGTFSISYVYAAENF